MNNESMLDKISPIKNNTTLTVWNNNKVGYIVDLKGDCCFRFIEIDYNNETGNCCEKYKQDEKEQQPIISCGFVGWLFRYKGNITTGNNILFITEQQRNLNRADSIQIFDDYLTVRLDMYKKAHKDDPDLFKRDLEKEFYSIHKEQEKQLVEKSKAINEFLPDCDVQLIQEFVNCYFEYVDGKTPDSIKKQQKQADKQPRHFTIKIATDEATKIYNGLKGGGFIAIETPCNNFLYRFGIIDKADTNEPIRWIKTNSTTKGIMPNKKSLLDLLTLLGVYEKDITDKQLINDIFTISNGNKFKANNYKYNNGKLDTTSEYHNDLVEIVNKGKEK